MSSLKQIEANRRNAQKSTGPKTEEGRAAVRLNSLKHGLSAETLVLPGESAEEFEAFVGQYESENRPTTMIERRLVRQMAMADWRLCRLERIEAAVYLYELEDHKETLDRYELNDDARLAWLVSRQDNDRTLSSLSRHQSCLERSFRTALQELSRIRKEAKQNAKEDAEVVTEPEPLASIGFALQKPPEPPPATEPPAVEPAATRIGFVLRQQPIANSQQPLYQHPRSNIRLMI